jgi:hypothetical protein
MLTGFLKKKSVIFLLILVLLYNITFNRVTGNFLLTYVFTQFSTGSFTGKVKQFSLFYGIEINSISIRSGSDFDNQVLFSCDRLALQYNLPYIFLGKLKLSEISLTKPFVQILEKNGKLNVATLFPPSDAKPKEPKPEGEPLGDEINLYLPVSAYLNFFIEDLSFRMEKEKGEKYFLTEEKNLDLKLLVATKRFRKIPLNASIVSIFETIQLSVNPTRELQVLFHDNHNKINQGIAITLILNLDSEANPPEFHSKLNLGSEQIQLTVKNRSLPPFGLNISYDLNYLPIEDTLELSDLAVKFDKTEWLQAKGKISKAITEDREFNLEIFKSRIELLPVASIYRQIPGLPNLDFRGNLELAPITVTGKMNSLVTNADLKVKDFFLKQNASSHNIPFLNLKATANLDLLTKQEPTKENPVPLLKSASLKTDLSYNTLLADLSAEIDNGKKIQALLNLKSLYLKNFVNGIGGRLSGKASLEGNTFSDLNASVNASINGFDYSVKGSKSGLNNVDLSLLATLALGDKLSFQSANLKNISLKIKNDEYKEALGLAVNGKLAMNPKLDVNIDKFGLTPDLGRLIPILPLSLKEQIAPLKKTIGNRPTLDGRVHYKDSNDSMLVDGMLNIALPGININDFRSDFAVKIAKDTTGEITISKFIFTALNGVLTGSANGNLIKKANQEKPPLGPYYPSLTAKLTLSSEKQIEIINGIKFDGNINLDLSIKDYSAKGKLDSKDSNFVYYSGTCKENDYTTCNLAYINRINIDFPFEHNLKIRITKNLIEGNKSKFISTYGQNLPANFTIHNVIGTHPYIQNDLFKFLQENGVQPGFTARLDYKENVLNIHALKISTLDGFIFGKDILFNIGNANVDEMEYAAAVQIKDIDLKQLLPLKSRKEIADGKIRADINLSGKNLKDPIANLNLFFSVFKIGEDFGKSAIRIVSPPNLLTDGIIGSYSQINKIEVELSKGLVYADILFQRSILSTVFMGIDNNKISQERMPLANFLNRAQSEVSKYE